MNSKLPYNKQVQLSSIKSNVTENVIKFKALEVDGLRERVNCDKICCGVKNPIYVEFHLRTADLITQFQGFARLSYSQLALWNSRYLCPYASEIS